MLLLRGDVFHFFFKKKKKNGKNKKKKSFIKHTLKLFKLSKIECLITDSTHKSMNANEIELAQYYARISNSNIQLPVNKKRTLIIQGEIIHKKLFKNHIKWLCLCNDLLILSNVLNNKKDDDIKNCNIQIKYIFIYINVKLN